MLQLWDIVVLMHIANDSELHCLVKATSFITYSCILHDINVQRSRVIDCTIAQNDYMSSFDSNVYCALHKRALSLLTLQLLLKTCSALRLKHCKWGSSLKTKLKHIIRHET